MICHGKRCAVTGYNRSHIFFTGGDYCYELATVSVYSVDTGVCSPCPNLNIARSNHSSCVLDDKLYVSGGMFQETDSIEVAKCSELIDGSATWDILSVRYKAYCHVFSPISSHEILIIFEKDISIFDTRSNTIEKVGENKMKLSCPSNNFVMSRDGQVVALVYDGTNYSEKN